MNINYFKEFVVLAQTKNYWEAAERLSINQSTLSKHIKSMEEELGVNLFSRTTRRVDLTEYGQVLLPYARSVMQLQFEYTSELLKEKMRRKNLVTIGCIPTMAQYGLTDIIVNFKNQYSDCNVKVIEDDSNNLKGFLMDKTCDAVFLRESEGAMETDALFSEKIIRILYAADNLVAAVSKNHPLSNKKEIALRSLKDESFCFLKEKTMLYDLCCSACREAGFVPNIIFDSHRIDSILDMAERTNSVAILTDKQVEYPAGSKVNVECSLSVAKIIPTVSTYISLCLLKNEPLSYATKQFMQYFKKRYQWKYQS